MCEGQTAPLTGSCYFLRTCPRWPLGNTVLPTRKMPIGFRLAPHRPGETKAIRPTDAQLSARAAGFGANRPIFVRVLLGLTQRQAGIGCERRSQNRRTSL